MTAKWWAGGRVAAVTCHCGCVGIGPCVEAVCNYGCGRRATTPWGTCGPCEDEATGRDDQDDED